MNIESVIEQLELAISLINQNGKDWLDERDIPVLKKAIEVCKNLGTTADSTPKSEQPERKTGVWLIRRFGSDAQCSECKTFFSDVYDMENSDNYCRHCGAKMEGLRRVKDEI